MEDKTRSDLTFLCQKQSFKKGKFIEKRRTRDLIERSSLTETLNIRRAEKEKVRNTKRVKRRERKKETRDFDWFNLQNAQTL